MRILTPVAVAVVLLAMFLGPGSLASPSPPTILEARAAIRGAGGSDAVSYSHHDCAGPGLPGTEGPHAAHTTRVTGFVFNGNGINFGINALALFGAGPCPATADADVLHNDFTGSIRITSVCRGTINDGALAADWTLSFVAGGQRSSSFVPGVCQGYAGDAFALDVTVTMGAVDALPGVPVEPIGGVTHTIAQP